MSCCPDSTGSGESVFVSWRSAAGSTVVCAPAELLDGFRSPASEATLAWFVTVPWLFGRTLIWTLAVPPLATVPSAHVTVPADSEQLPWEALAESKVELDGSMSVTVTPVAPCGPALETPRV